MSVRLADKSFKYPVGIAKNMLIEVSKFTFSTDFDILEMQEDSKVPLILGRPFLHTVDAVIRVKQKQLNLGVGTEGMIFNIDSAMKHSYSNDDTCFSIDVINEILDEDFDALLNEGSKILHSIEGTLLEEEIFLLICECLFGLCYCSCQIPKGVLFGHSYQLKYSERFSSLETSYDND
ncbi:reverse transcriptase domain-containing protein [Tanacetum coccineum]